MLLLELKLHNCVQQLLQKIPMLTKKHSEMVTNDELYYSR